MAITVSLLATVAVGLAMHRRAQRSIDARLEALAACESALASLQAGRAWSETTPMGSPVTFSLVDTGEIEALPGWHWVVVQATLANATHEASVQLEGAVRAEAVRPSGGAS